MKKSIGRRCTLVSSRLNRIAKVDLSYPAHPVSYVQDFMATKLYNILTRWHVPLSTDLLCMCSSGEQHACCYCFRKGLIRKAHLCHNTKKWAAKHPEGWLAKSVPESFIFELDDIDYIEEALCDVPEVGTMFCDHAHVMAHASSTPPNVRSSYAPQCMPAELSMLICSLLQRADRSFMPPMFQRSALSFMSICISYIG